MKKTLLLLSLILCAVYGFSQTAVFYENFELPSGADSVASSGNPGWTINSTLASEGTQSYHSGLAPNSSSSFTTNKFVTTGSFNVLLSFDQIAKVSFFDEAIIEVSIDSVTWVHMTSSFVTYLGGGDFSNDKFTATSYLSDWDPGNASAVPTNSWWKTELFDISAIAADQPEFWLRFTVTDNDGDGSGGNYGWLVDDVKVITSTCELIPPTITYNAPVLQGAVSGTGPYNISVDIFDLSGVMDATLTYTLNSVAQTPILMTNTTASTYEANIPGASVGDIICYQVTATDNSGCNNTATEPSSPNCFTVTSTPSTIDIGTGTLTNTGTTYPAPYGNWYWGARHQMLITAAEMQAAGATQAVNIQSLAFDVVTPGGAPLQNFEIKIGHTTQTDMTSWVPQSQLTSVFVTSVYNDVTGWNVHTFSTPFAWNGTDNIVVETCFNNNSFTTNAEHHLSVTPGIYTRWYRADAAGVCANTGQTGTSNERPNMRLEVAPPQPFDAGVVQILQPGGVAAAGQSLPVEVVIRNFGLNPINNFDIEYTVNGAPGGTLTINTPIAPSATDTVTMVNFTVPSGNFTICAYSSLSGDGWLQNDTVCKNIFGIPSYNLSYTTDFDGTTDWYAQPTTGQTVWQLGTPTFGATNSSLSAPNAWDVNLNSAYGPNATAYLYSPIFNIVNGMNARLSFWQNRNTQLDQDGFRLEYTLDGGNTWSTLGTSTSQDAINWYNTTNLTSSNEPGWTGSSTGWVQSLFYLSSTFDNQQVQFRFVFNSNGFTQLDGVSIDDFSIEEASALDAGVKRVISPTIHQAGASVPATVVVKNYGLNTITSFDITYDIGAGPVMPALTWNIPLAPGDSVTVPIGNLTVPSGSFNFCAFVTLVSDGNISNDTLCSPALGVPTISVTSTSTFFDDYDATNVGWSTSTGAVTTTIWELGTPAFGQTNSAYSTPNSWDINLSTGYEADAEAYLVSPYFDFSTAVSPVLSFYQNRSSQLNNDGFRIQYSINNGAWQNLGGVGSGTNWYNTTNLSSSNTSGWSGSSNGWILSSLNLPSAFNNQPLVQFRFVFTSNGFTNGDGVSIDNFEIFVPVSLSAATQNISLSNVLLLPGASQTVQAQIKNKGTSALQNVNITLAVDGNPIVTDNISFTPPLPGFPNNVQVYSHIFTQPWIATPGAHTISVFTTSPNASADQNPSDDTTYLSVTVFDSTGTPYCNDFEGSQPQWVALNAYSYSTSSKWELGMPAQTILNSTFNGSNAWMTDLNANYGPRDSSGLFSPVFGMTAGQCYKVNFQHIFSTELFQDGGTMEYSIDGTATWNALGSYNQPNWYNTQYIAALGNNPPRPGWSGQASGWQLAENFIGFSTPQNIIFRFRFSSDMTLFDEGWAIDQFCFEEDPANQCVLITDITQLDAPSGLVLDQNYPNPAGNSTVISYILPERGDVSLTLINVLGQEVKVLQSGIQNSGPHSVEVDLKDIEAGIYYYMLNYNDGEIMVKKMVVTK